MPPKQGYFTNSETPPKGKNKGESKEKLYAPFSLLSCKKVFSSKNLPRKKLHLLIYIFLFAPYIGLTTLNILLITIYPEQLTRSNLAAMAAELVITLSIITAISRSRRFGHFHGWAYTLNLFININLIAGLWSLFLFLSIMGGAVYLDYVELIDWHQDDLTMMSEIVYIYLFWSGAKYFRKEC